jgi:hypothetical protein
MNVDDFTKVASTVLVSRVEFKWSSYAHGLVHKIMQLKRNDSYPEATISVSRNQIIIILYGFNCEIVIAASTEKKKESNRRADEQEAEDI